MSAVTIPPLADLLYKSGSVVADDIVLKTPFSAESLIAALRRVAGEVI